MAEGSLTGEADEPVGADASEKDLMPSGVHRFQSGEVDGLLPRKVLLASSDDSHEEQHAGQIAEKGDEPAFEEIEDGDPSVEESHGHEHDVAGEEIGSGEDDHHEADGEDNGSDHSDETYVG
ncbi:MAG: hypothetical protein Q9212_003079 [Teloschistes hypoglaucus]